MKNNDKKFIVPRMFLALMVIFIVIYFISVIAGFSPFYTNMAEKNALLNAHKDAHAADTLVAERYQDLYDLEAKIKDALEENPSHDAISTVLTPYKDLDTFGSLRFFSKGNIYDVDGLKVEDEVKEIKSFINLNRKSCSKVYYYELYEKHCIAFYIPVVGSDFIDGLVSIVKARNFISLDTVLNEQSLLSTVISSNNGDCLVEKSSSEGLLFEELSHKVTLPSDEEDAEPSIGNDYYTFIENFTQNSQERIKVEMALKSGATEGVVHINAQSEAYTVAFKGLENTESKYFIVSLSLSENLILEEMWYLRHIVFLLVIAVTSFTVSLVYAVLYHKNAKKQIKLVSYTYPNIDCPNLEQFKLDIINATNNAPVALKKYSIVAFKISGYSSLSKYLGEAATEDIVKQAAKIFAGICEYEETYAYLGNGAFVLYLSYTEKSSFSRRISIIKAISMKNKSALDKNVHLRFNIGVCHAFGGTKSAVNEMVDNAVTAANIAKGKANRLFVVYDIKINEKLAKDEKIESMMEDSLKNGDFKLFLQPKYNIKHDRIDSAEALVRWFDHSRADYIFPGEFISLFETNGFIVKLDHYVYLEVLKYFQRAVERGEKIVPISVNVSRVTASMEDFLDFYIENKKKYGIGDGFLMLEFTESFAVDDNDNILRIVKTLRKNGILCSLDDFGSGFSSFNVLKNIPFDELKLDKCFIDAGYNVAHDEIMLRSVIDLAKSLGMRIVQEGVETEEVFNKVKEYGCDVMQGYYYAKAIPSEEFRIFVESNTSIVYKSKVK